MKLEQMSDQSKSVGTLIALGVVSGVASLATKLTQESFTKQKIVECAKLAHKSSDQWLRDWHTSFGQCVEVEFKDILQNLQ